MRGALAQGTGEVLDLLKIGMLMIILMMDSEAAAVVEVRIVGPRTLETAAVIG